MDAHVNEIFGFLIPPWEDKKWFVTLNDLVNWIGDNVLDEHFLQYWTSNIKNHEHSGHNLIDEINQLNPETVLDVGCGKNYFKNKINNLIGIDPIFDNADIKIDILEYDGDINSFDVILVLGSINFGSEEYILKQLEKAISLCKNGGRIYFRVNPGISNPNSPWMDYFEWDKDKIIRYAKTYNLEVSDIKEDYGGRLVFTYIK